MITHEQEKHLREDIKNFACLIQRQPQILLEAEAIRSDSIVLEIASKYLNISSERQNRLASYMSNCSLFLRLLCEE